MVSVGKRLKPGPVDVTTLLRICEISCPVRLLYCQSGKRHPLPQTVVLFRLNTHNPPA